MTRVLIVFILGLTILTQYVNCSSYSDSTFDNTLSGLNNNTVDTYEGVKALNGETYMNCNEDHVQLGGICNTADSLDNYIEYRIQRERQTVYWGTGSQMTAVLRTARCENGRFFAIVPKPNDSALAVSGRDHVEYQILFQIYSSKDRLTYTAGPSAPIFNMYIQKNGGCSP